ncbi:hypothetical protein QMK19_23285 [Streptomyces sp. H10-C2]|uniref:hypothetical protein n=1 Tax=unclassified Streptomyces TaxID=2593676 RepID=UPI0024BB7A6D|nr:MULTISPECIES: hypothetical protein [unclassified Streptomyces]MDJ0342831.1 hypothetical protein [Streptomyces sp. PH10-H1]MDJ0372509.1 hypothetical protein [Streptomyces sp. H10-C2]
MNSDHGRRFGPDFVAEQLRRYQDKPPERRALSYDITVGEEYEPWRDWLDGQIAMLPDTAAATFAAKLWQDQHFWPGVIELGVGAALRATDHRVEYEQTWDGLTPDWTVLRKDGRPLALVEVLTDSPSQALYGQVRAWHSLVERIKAIPVPVVLALAGNPSGPAVAPDARTAKRITLALRRFLMSPLITADFRIHGYHFQIQGDPRTGRLLQPPVFGAIFTPPSGLAGPVTATALVERIDEKVRKYRVIAQAAELPLLIAAGAHPFTGVGLQQLDHLLDGRLTTTLQFNFGDNYLGPPQDINPSFPRRWAMPADLAGVLWIDNVYPFGATWRPNGAAARPAPEALTKQWATR